MVTAASIKPIYRTYEDFPIEELLMYAGIDCIVTSELAARTMPHLLARPKYTFYDTEGVTLGRVEPMIKAIEDVEMKAFEYIVDMEINGFLYYKNENRKLAERMVREIGELEALIFSDKGADKTFEITGAGLTKLLYVELGLEPPSMTKGGEPSTDGDALKALAKSTGFKWLEWLAKRNDINAAYNTFIKSYIDDFVKPDGKIHPNYNLHGTSSFRITGDKPNLTQLPRERYGYNTRDCYGCPPGYIFFAADFSSAEVKILGALSKDPTLLDAIAKGRDFHSVSASAMMGIDYDEFVKIRKNEEHPLCKQYNDMRQNAKALTFGIDGASKEVIPFSKFAQLLEP